jgi:pyruvate,water dikinase
MNYTVGFGAIGRDDLAVAGGKGANLGELVRAGMPVPPGYVIGTSAYLDFVEANGLGERIRELATGSAAQDDPSAAEDAASRIQVLFTGGAIPDAMAKEIGEAYLALAPERQPVAVRSSATAEDLPGASFAGQQETYLNIRGSEALLDAVRRCWASLWTARAMTYRVRQGIPPETVSLAVVVQTMVESEASGVMFTANPSNGRRNEVAIGAAWGLGESVVSGTVNTDDLVVDKAAGRVLSRQVADKTVSTVYVDAGGTTELPLAADKRRRSVLDDAEAVELAALGAHIEEHFGAPQDIEWARADGRFQVVQSRPITALPDAEADPPHDWTVSHPKAFYFRASIVEQLPDPLSPLFADLAGPSVTTSLTRLFGLIFGKGALKDDDIALVTVNGYAYYRYSRAGLWRVTWRSPAATRMLRGDNAAHAGVKGWREYSHPRYQQVVADWTARSLPDLASLELLDGIRALLDAGTTYYTAVQSIIPIAATSEITFTHYYQRLVRRDGDPPAPAFLLGFDSLPILAEKSLYDLATWCREYEGLVGALRDTPSGVLAGRLGADSAPDCSAPDCSAPDCSAPDCSAPDCSAPDCSAPEGVADAVWREWRARFQEHLDRYGHTVYNLDFVNAVPADSHAPLLDALKFYLRGEGSNPYDRQRASAQRRDQAAASVRARLDRPRRAVFDRLLAWAQRTAPIREDALADIGLAWPLMRRMLRELGARLVATGTLESPDEVFWLTEAELTALAAAHDSHGDTARPGLRSAIEERRMIWRGRRRVTPPQLLPEGSGKFWERWMPAGSETQTGDVISGTAASAGQVTGTARVLAGPADFGRMQSGDVLVASITTPAWTTLFAMASGVVTDVGGPLSHSSIVAREYGIPAVLGTSVATRRIRDGQRIRVDGDAGTVTLLDGDADVT